MGMYHDFSRVSREDWKYAYKGSDLLALAEVKLKEFKVSEEAERKKMSDLMLNNLVSASGREVEECKNQIAHFGKLREQCEVFVHEFKRTPEREFNLALGDVTFFGLQETPF